jgi:hypothetical protein
LTQRDKYVQGAQYKLFGTMGLNFDHDTSKLGQRLETMSKAEAAVPEVKVEVGEVVAEVAAAVVAEVAAEVVAEVAAEVVAETAVEVVAEAAGTVVTDVAVEAEVATEVAAAVVTETANEVVVAVVEVAAKVVAEVANEVVAVVAVEVAAEVAAATVEAVAETEIEVMEAGVGKRNSRVAGRALPFTSRLALPSARRQVFAPAFVSNVILKPVFSSTNLEQAFRSSAPISLRCPSKRSVATLRKRSVNEVLAFMILLSLSWQIKAIAEPRGLLPC